MAKLYERNGWWSVTYRVNGKRVREALGTRNRKLAEKKKLEIEYLLSTRRLGLPSRTPVEELLAEYFKHVRAHREHKSAETAIGRLRRTFDDIDVKYLEQLTPDRISLYLNERVVDGEIGQKTANEYRVCLHTLFAYAIETKGFNSRDPLFPNPVKRVKRFKQPKGRIRFLTMPQIREQLDGLAPWPQLKAMVATYIYAGLRRSEGLWLTVDDLTLKPKSRVIRVHAKTIDGEYWESKTGENRVVPVSNALRQHLAEWLLRRPTDSPWLFPSPDSCRYDPDNFSKKLTRRQKTLGLVWGTNDFRHTSGSHLAQKGESLYKISRLMGNSPEICRRHYAALVPSELTDTVEFDVQAPVHKAKSAGLA